MPGSFAFEVLARMDGGSHRPGRRPSFCMTKRIILAGTFVGFGGVETHLRWLGQALVQGGDEILSLSFGPTPGDPQEVARIARRLPGTEVVFVDRTESGASTLGRFRAVKSVLRRFRPDVYLACGTGWNLFAPAVLGWRRPRLVFHEVMSGEATGWRDSRWLVRRGFDEVIAQAAPVARNFERAFGWPGTVPVLPAFPEPLEAIARIPAAAPRRVPLGTARAGFFSRLVPHKRAAWLVEQWPRLRGSLRELHIYGTGSERVQIEAMIAAQGWGDRVFCHGPYPSGQAYVDLFAGLDLTLLPTVGAEGAPLVLLEAMACGVPFVATDAGGITDYANPDCLLAPWREPDKFLASVEALAARLDARTVDQGRLQRFYQERFSFAALGKRWREFLGSL